MANKKDFLLSKLDNLINWIEKEKLVEINHELILKLKSLKTNYDDLLLFIMYLSQKADSNCDICISDMNAFFLHYEIKLTSFSKDVIEKITRYIKCFVKTIRN